MGVSVAFRDGGDVTGFYLPFRHSNLGGSFNHNVARFLPVLQRILDTKLCVYHNAKFDLVSLQTLGLRTHGPDRRFVDTMVLAHLLDENRPYSGKSLDSCSRYYLKDEGGKRKSEDLKEIIKVFGWGAVSPDHMAEYGMYDAVLTLRLFEVLQPKLTAERLGNVWPEKKRFLELLIKMEGYGIQVDTNLCEEMALTGHREMVRLKQLLKVNPASNKGLKVLLNNQLGLPVYMSPKTGKPSYDKDAMAWYEDLLSVMGDTRAQRILEYRGWQKSVSSNYESYLKHLSPDGRLRPNYLMHGTVTGRLSCREPNLQQIPKAGNKPWNGKMKQCFVPRPGYVLISVDYSQLELRLATVYAQEESLVRTFQENRDIFTEMSSQLGMTRNDTKTLVYSIQYGAGLKRISNAFQVTPAKAKALRDNYSATYPKFQAASDRASEIVRNYGQIILWSGRRRHFLYPKDDDYMAFNSICQGGAADIVERSMLRLDDEGLNDGDNCRILLQIHDEIVAEVREDLEDEYRTLIAESMGRVDFVPRLSTVKFKAEPKRWGEK